VDDFGSAAAIAGASGTTDWPDPSAGPGTVTTTGITRSMVDHTVPPDAGTAMKQTPDIGNTSAVGE
jgi:hypothetical protein